MSSARQTPTIGVPALIALGEAAFVLRFGDSIDADLNRRVLGVCDGVRAARLAGVLDLVPAYATLTVFFDPAACDREALAGALRAIAHSAPCRAPEVGRLVELPVCYEAAFAPDMRAVCAHTGFDAHEVMRRHCAPEYRVHFLGFTPGFPYLGGLDPALATPRRATPRLRVPAGAVAIGGAQTGIYPQAAPGGWQIIGRTFLRLFDPDRDSPCLLQAGDTLRFVAIDASEFARLSGAPA